MGPEVEEETDHLQEVEKETDHMDSLHNTLQSLNRKLELLKQGAEMTKTPTETEENIQQVMMEQPVVTVMREGAETEQEIHDLHMMMEMHNNLPIAERIENLIVENHEMKHIDDLIPETTDQDVTDIEGIEDQIAESHEMDDLIPEPIGQDDLVFIRENEIVEDGENTHSTFEPEHTTKLNSDLVLKDSGLDEKETEVEDDSEALIKVTSKGSPNGFIPTAIPREAENSLKSRRRNLFKGLTKLHLPTSKPNKSQENTRKSKLEPSNKFKLRKLFRSSDRNEITIVEKSNPRKIIFRKGLVRGQRRKVGSGKRNDPLVKSLQKQIRTQSNRLFSKRKPFTKIAPTSTASTTTQEVGNERIH